MPNQVTFNLAGLRKILTTDSIKSFLCIKRGFGQ